MKNTNNNIMSGTGTSDYVSKYISTSCSSPSSAPPSDTLNIETDTVMIENIK